MSRLRGTGTDTQRHTHARTHARTHGRTDGRTHTRTSDERKRERGCVFWVKKRNPRYLMWHRREGKRWKDDLWFGSSLGSKRNMKMDPCDKLSGNLSLGNGFSRIFFSFLFCFLFVLYVFVRSSLCRRQNLPNICTLFCLVHIIFNLLCVLICFLGRYQSSLFSMLFGLFCL